MEIPKLIKLHSTSTSNYISASQEALCTTEFGIWSYSCKCCNTEKWSRVFNLD